MKKRKTYAAVMFAAGLLSLFACVPAFADTEGFSEEYSRFQNPDGLMDEEDANQLNEELDEISHNRNFDVTATLVNSLNGQSPEAYADYLYDVCDFGYGDNRDGVLLLVSLEDRDWYLSTSGYGITAFTDAGIQYIGEEITSQLADGEYLEAFEKYIELCDDFIDAANNGEVYDTDHMPRKPLSAIWLGISFAVGLGGALLLVGVNKSELKSVRMQEEAKNYVRPGSMKVTKSGDFFLYRHVTRTERPKANPKSSGGGGSSTHTSSSGRTHGGGGGKF
ncbi:TPM domain-containing protein [Clostridium sp. OM02-18AC]|uniref:TPM domain-containing protein n=1 Tax=Clostridium sp. OM02-18AC TaxID=2292311 RepID=UPI000E49A802|nr:TPM domain-containing protein [Clostridium sp. OM02-18AC]RHV67938.1 TPM domain-containing protein [Clostridium sp. OM02-18AC]